ncbi:multivesicular body subunit 12A-like isoform X2 [Anguilla anguilla]|uniref:multivesicular body subunit 12A-like isoform X2 n=1 Tax=Anguilla anguilla TaxID=7936 RepID=UPI0015AB61CE|nr:multivesicular body subunit 12A-like isoform X2 [Anguilla anguilla]
MVKGVAYNREIVVDFPDRMSLREHSSAPCLPVTAVAWTSNASSCPNDLTLVNTTEDGATANFGRGFGKSGYYLCYSMKTGGGMVVSDMQVISEKESTPHGYCYIPEYLEAKASVWRKKRVCVLIVPLGTVETAVLDIKLTTKSRVVLPYYTCLGEVHGFVIWCKKGAFSGPPPQIKPRSVSLDIRKLSLEQPEPPKHPQTSNDPFTPGLGKLSQRRGNLHKKDNLENISENSLNSPSAMDGIPFALHPKFESQNISSVPSDSLILCIKSVQDIESEYNYAFSVEENAAKPDPPRTSLASSSATPPALPARPK